jgi:hypothetical protein
MGNGESKTYNQKIRGYLRYLDSRNVVVNFYPSNFLKIFNQLNFFVAGSGELCAMENIKNISEE